VRRSTAAARRGGHREARAAKGEGRGELELSEGMEEVLRARGIGRRWSDGGGLRRRAARTGRERRLGFGPRKENGRGSNGEWGRERRSGAGGEAPGGHAGQASGRRHAPPQRAGAEGRGIRRGG
jgi:hypothetical protein